MDAHTMRDASRIELVIKQGIGCFKSLATNLTKWDDRSKYLEQRDLVKCVNSVISTEKARSGT